MPTTQRPKMIRDPIQNISIRRSLRSRIVQRECLRAIDPRGQRWRHIIRQIQRLEWEIDHRFHFICEMTLDGEALQMNEKNGW